MKEQLFLFSTMCLFIQGTGIGRPTQVLLIEREEIKPGKLRATKNWQTAMCRVLRKQS